MSRMAGGSGTCAHYWLFNMLLFLLCTFYTLCIAQTDPEKHPCLNLTNDEGDTKLQALANSFSTDTNVKDIVIAMDRSLSINEPIFEQQKDVASNLLEFLSNEGRLILHYEYTRLAIITYGKQSLAEVDGTSSPKNAITSCNVEGLIEKLVLDNKKTNSSLVADALRDARTIFEDGRRDGRNPQQYLWLFFDGENTEYNKEVTGKTAKDWMNEIKGAKVKVFTAGIGGTPGGWMGREGEKNVISLATDKRHYACVETWLRVLRNGTAEGSKDGPAELQPHQRFIEVGEFLDPPPCGECPGDKVCTCDIIEKNYGCTVPQNTSDPNPPNTVYVTVPSGPALPLWVIIAIIVAATLVVVIIIISVAVAITRRRRKRENQDDREIYEGPPLPPPPVIARKTKPGFDFGQEDENEPTYGNMTDAGDGYINVDDNGMQEYATVPYPYVEVDNEVHENMPGWPEHLATLNAAHNLSHLSIYSTATRQWATTPKFHLSNKELKELARVFRQGSEYKGDHITMHGERYHLDTATSSQLNMHASRQKGHGHEEVAHLCNVGEFIIIAVADKVKDTECQNVVYELKIYVDQKLNTGETASGFDPAYGGNNYSPIYDTGYATGIKGNGHM